MTYDPNAEPTHPIPEELEAKLVEAKQWYDRLLKLEFAIRTKPGIAERNQSDRDDMAREGASLMEEIVEIIDVTWGWGPKADRT